MTEMEEVRAAIAKQLCAWEFYVTLEELEPIWEEQADHHRRPYYDNADEILSHPLIAVLSREQPEENLNMSLEKCIKLVDASDFHHKSTIRWWVNWAYKANSIKLVKGV